MNHNLLDIICCPNCNKKLQVKIFEEKKNEIFSGVLICECCRSKFQIINYIPRLIKNYNYSKSWGTLWKETVSYVRDSYTGVPFYYNVIHGKYNEDNLGEEKTSPFGFNWPTKLSGENILEIGPGTGNCTEHLLKTGANIFSVDMSDAIDTFTEDMLTHPRINVIQADINSKLFSDIGFDKIWFFQVLQHTPSPSDTLKNIYKLLRKGGELAVTSYAGKYNPWYYRFTKRINDRLMWRFISLSCPIMVRIKYWLMKFFKSIKLNFMKNFTSKVLDPFDPRNIYYKTLEGEFKDWPYGMVWEKTKSKKILMKLAILNTFDRITPNYTNSASHGTIEKWLKEAGFYEINIWGKSGVRAKAIR